MVIVQALAEIRSKELNFDDIVEAKGQAPIFDLFDPPGRRKTLITEATSEHIWRPHQVISGDLGSVPLRGSLPLLRESLTWPLCGTPPPSPTGHGGWSPRSTLACSNDGLRAGRRVRRLMVSCAAQWQLYDLMTPTDSVPITKGSDVMGCHTHTAYVA